MVSQQGVTASIRQSTGRRSGSQILLLGAIVGLFLLTALLVSPVGEFPLNDDWIYAKTVQRLLAEGHYRGHPYSAANLVAQSYWGALFCQLFGFSFTALRLSTLVLSCVGAWAVAQCGLALGLSSRLALLGAVVVAVNPIALMLSYSFMTEMPFLALSSLSGLFYLLYLRQPSPSRVFWGSLFAILSFFVRQHGLITPIAFVVTLLVLSRQQRYRWTWRDSLIFVGLWLGAAGGYRHLLAIQERGTPVLQNLNDRLFVAAMDGLRHPFVGLAYMGLLALPLVLGRLWQWGRRYDRRSPRQVALWMGFCVVSLGVLGLPRLLAFVKTVVLSGSDGWLGLYPHRMPLLKGDSLFDLGVGHIQLPDLNPMPVVQIQDWWWLPTIVAIGGAGFLFLNTGAVLRDNWQPQPNRELDAATAQRLFLVLWAWAALLSAYNPWRVAVFDRYLLPALIPFVLLLADEVSRFRSKGAIQVATLACVLIYGFSLAGLQDYLGWNRTAWQAQNRLLTEYKVAPESIRGVDPFNGIYNSEKHMQRYNTKDFWQANIAGKGPWVLDDQYVVASVEPRPGYQVLERDRYFSWLAARERTIVTFKRQP
jgi:hypothetical protein